MVNGLTPRQIDLLQRYIAEVQDEGHGMVIIMIENGIARYIIPAPSLNFLPGGLLDEYNNKVKNNLL